MSGMEEGSHRRPRDEEECEQSLADKAHFIYQYIGHLVGGFWQTPMPTGCTQVGTGTEATGSHKQVYTVCQKMKLKALVSDPKSIFFIFIKKHTQKWHFARNNYTRDYITANFYSFPDTWCQPLLDESWFLDVRHQP